MGETLAKITIAPLTNRKRKIIRALVDTGATYTMLPRKVLKSLGVKEVQRITVQLADGRLAERDLGNAMLILEGRTVANPVVFGEEDDAIIIGLVTLESCGLTVDPIRRKLLPLKAVHQFLSVS